MQGTKDRTFALATTAQPQGGGRRRSLVGGALALALVAGGVTAAALGADRDREPRRSASSQEALGQQAAHPERTSGGGGAAPPAAPAGDRAAADAVPAGTYGARVLAEGWDEQGRYVVIDRGRLTDGPPAEPGVDGTRPVLFDTGAVAERRRVDLADGHSLRFARSGGEPSYGSGSWADFVTELSGRDAGMLATVRIDADGRLTALEEPYRP